MDPAEKLLSHFERITGTEYIFAYKVSPDHTSPAIQVLLYAGFPEQGTITGFTFGLSHFHPDGGGHKELMISMRTADHAWALACGEIAYQLREECPFVCGDTINFREPISESSRMNGFFVTHPISVSSKNLVIDLGFRRIELVEVIPVYESERLWIRDGGSLDTLLESRTRREFLDPTRQPFIPPTSSNPN